MWAWVLSGPIGLVRFQSMAKGTHTCHLPQRWQSLAKYKEENVAEVTNDCQKSDHNSLKSVKGRPNMKRTPGRMCLCI